MLKGDIQRTFKVKPAPLWKQNLYSNNLVQLSAGADVLSYPGHCDESWCSRTNDSASRHRLCSFEVSVFASRQPLWLSVSVVSIFPPQSLSLSLPPIFSPSSLMQPFSFPDSSVCFPHCHLPYLFFISSSSLLLHPMLWVNHASQSLVGRTVSTAHGNLSMMKTCNS